MNTRNGGNHDPETIEQLNARIRALEELTQTLGTMLVNQQAGKKRGREETNWGNQNQPHHKKPNQSSQQFNQRGNYHQMNHPKGIHFNNNQNNNQSFKQNLVRGDVCKSCNRDHPGKTCEGQTIVCYVCGKPGHKSFECPTKPNLKPHKFKPPTKNQSLVKKSVCRKCYRDHWGKTCEGETFACFICGKLGHKSFECPMKLNPKSNNFKPPHDNLGNRGNGGNDQGTNGGGNNEDNRETGSNTTSVAGRINVETIQEAEADDGVIAGTFLVNFILAYVLFVQGASESFVSTSSTNKLDSILPSHFDAFILPRRENSSLPFYLS